MGYKSNYKSSVNMIFNFIKVYDVINNNVKNLQLEIWNILSDEIKQCLTDSQYYLLYKFTELREHIDRFDDKGVYLNELNDI
ncbi:predicted protein [Histoplasma mississippiense (nom. inval.)]|uniref:predicted protein n=1 Tax=Ajellomyces capsulatus (strain NAm1 / WU24) TaxID=2059318 RepID=UPI000157B6B9|nr:predicted protein [Histoplasma mississippiense (nom. inval.)]EDN03170.1 predicted protein [Histoplasma mississippiense (nom. inval.)]